MTLLPFPVFSIAVGIILVLGYFILWVGLKVFRITSVSSRQIVGYIFASAVLNLIVDYLAYHPLYPAVEKLFLTLGRWPTALILFAAMYSISLVGAYFLLRYILKLTGRELLKLFLYLALIGIVSSVIISMTANVLLRVL